jgi:hypothetical protein
MVSKVWLANHIGRLWATRCELVRSITSEFVSRHFGKGVEAHEVSVRCPTVLGQFNSLIIDFISLFFGLISRFGRLGNLPIDQGTRSQPTYSAPKALRRLSSLCGRR